MKCGNRINMMKREASEHGSSGIGRLEKAEPTSA